MEAFSSIGVRERVPADQAGDHGGVPGFDAGDRRRGGQDVGILDQRNLAVVGRDARAPRTSRRSSGSCPGVSKVPAG